MFQQTVLSCGFLNTQKRLSRLHSDSTLLVCLRVCLLLFCSCVSLRSESAQQSKDVRESCEYIGTELQRRPNQNRVWNVTNVSL